ncbi:MAG: LuxR C-terminal-related transcriptional regulator [Rikenellaceae bacterium]|nr:LuxR C-terminal-related transcriptional regulator [Rikenellaceae bacterium]
MPEQRKIIFRLSRYEGRTNMEIAEALGLSVRTVERHIYLALADLKKVLKSYLPVE